MMEQLRFTFILSTLFILLAATSTWADVGEMPYPGGLITPGDKTSDIKMKSEKVLFEIKKNTGIFNTEYTKHYAKVTATFEMENLTSNKITKKTFFPFHYYGELEFLDEMSQVKNAKVTVAGSPKELTHEILTLPAGYSNGNVAAGVFEADFEAGATTEIRVEYDLRGVNEPKSSSISFEYFMETGSHWAGTIENGEVVFDFWQDVDNKIVFSAVNGFFEISNGKLVWLFNNLEPTMGHNIKVTFDPKNLETWVKRPTFIKELQASNTLDGVYVSAGLRKNEPMPGGQMDINPVNLLDKEGKERGWLVEQKQEQFSEWLNFIFDDTYKISGIKIRSGIYDQEWSEDYSTSTDVYNTFKRPKTVTIAFSDGTQQKSTLNDLPDKYQTIQLAGELGTSNIKLSFQDAYPGTGGGNDYFGLGRIELVGIEKVSPEPAGEETTTPAERETGQEGGAATPGPGLTVLILPVAIATIAGVLIGGLLVYLAKRGKQT